MKRLLKLGLLVAVVAAIVKVIATNRAEWRGLTESEVREKLHGKLDARMPREKVDEIADKAVDVMRRRGVLGEEAAGEAG